MGIKRITQYKLDPTLNWNIAEVISVNNNEIKFRTNNKKKKTLKVFNLKNIKWTLRQNKLIKDVHKSVTFFLSKKKKIYGKLKQYPKVNGAIVVLDPFNGDVLALVGGLISKKVNLTELHKQKDNQAQLLNQ